MAGIFCVLYAKLGYEIRLHAAVMNPCPYMIHWLISVTRTLIIMQSDSVPTKFIKERSYGEKLSAFSSYITSIQPGYLLCNLLNRDIIRIQRLHSQLFLTLHLVSTTQQITQ